MSGKFILYAVVVTLVFTVYMWTRLLAPHGNTGGSGYRSGGSSWSSNSGGGSWGGGGGGGHK